MKLFSLPLAATLLVSTLNSLVPLAAQDAPASSSTPAEKGAQLAQHLNLTDAQKQQIKQIRQDTPKGKERRQQIMAVLTPDQQAQLKQDIQQRRAQQSQ